MLINENQIKGIIAIFLILAIIPFIAFFANSFPDNQLPILSDQRGNNLAVEISHQDSVKGIYFIPFKTTANQLLLLAGIDVKTEKDFILEDGMKLFVDANSTKKLLLSKIDNSRRLALGMPIDINGATEDELLLIPGIGEATARKILELRTLVVRFRNIDELTAIKGIKEKKLVKLKKYLYVQKK
jgi:competence protein ComEA